MADDRASANASAPVQDACPDPRPAAQPCPAARPLDTNAIYKARRTRDQIFGRWPGLFGEPAWDILLDLHANGLRGRPVSTTAACIAANVPATTALRYIAQLKRAGLIRGVPDQDRRRTWLELSVRGQELMADWLDTIK